MAGWPFSASPVTAYSQHAAIDPRNHTRIFISTVAKRGGGSPADWIPSAMVALEYDDIDWDGGEVSGLRAVDTVIYADASADSEVYLALQNIVPGRDQPIYDWTAPQYSQLHGPSFRPRFADHIYCEFRWLAHLVCRSHYNQYLGQFSRHHRSILQ